MKVNHLKLPKPNLPISEMIACKYRNAKQSHPKQLFIIGAHIIVARLDIKPNRRIAEYRQVCVLTLSKKTEKTGNGAVYLIVVLLGSTAAMNSRPFPLTASSLTSA